MRLLLAVPFAISFLSAPAAAQNLPTQLSTVYGGSGGTAFSRDCGAGRVMVGVRGREGLVVDAIGLLCAPVLADGKLGPASAVGSLVGGGGGSVRQLVCPSERPVLVGLGMLYGEVVNTVLIRCAVWTPITRSWSSDALYSQWTFGGDTFMANLRGDRAMCGNNRQPMAGIRGRAGMVVDALGIACDEP